MDNKVKLAIVAVVVIVVIAAVAAYALSDDDDDKKKDYSNTEIGAIGTYIPVYGNATGDLYINQDDVDMLQQIVDGDLVWNKNKAPFADANNDGSITQEDVDLVKKIVAKEQCTVKYLDYYDEVENVNYPLTNRNIAVTYYQQAEACSILGQMDNIKCASLAAAGQYTTLYPHLATLTSNQVFGTTGSSTLNDDAVEKIVKNEVTVVVGTPSSGNHEVTKTLREDRGIDTIMLWYNGDYCYSTIMTMALFFDEIERGEKYMAYCDDIKADLSSKITDSMKKNILILDNYYTSSAHYSFIASDANGSYTMINRYIGNAYSASDASQFGFAQRDIEWLTTNQSSYDYIVFLPTPCGFRDLRVDGQYQTGSYFSRADFNSEVEDTLPYLAKTNAYKNGNIVVSSYDNTFGYSTYAMLKLIAAQIYPDVYSVSQGLSALQEWFDTINVCNVNVKTDGSFSYTGTAYKTSYEQVSETTSTTDYTKVKLGDIGTYIPVYGNATCDLYIDLDDVDMLQQIVSGKLTWDKEAAPFADANNDGQITQADIDLVQQIIAKEQCTVKYLDYYGEVENVNYPLTDRKIAVTYYQQAEACSILGQMDNIVCSSLAAAGQYTTLYPHLATLTSSQVFGTTGSSTLNDDAVEKIVNNGVTVIVGTPSSGNHEVTKTLRENRGIDTIMLWYNGDYCYSTIMTMALFFDQIEKGEKYMAYCDAIKKDLSSKITDSMKKNILILDNYYSSSAHYSFIASDANGSYTMINRYIGNAYSASDASQFGFANRDIEWLTTNQSNYDYIVFLPTPCGFRDLRVDGQYQTGNYYSRADFNTSIESTLTHLTNTNAYRNGNIVVSSYDNTFGYSTYAMLKLIAAQIYPEVYSLEDGLNAMQEWFDNINVCKVDVKTQGAFSYTGSSYTTSYEKLSA